MKQELIIKVIAKELGTNDVDQLNKIFKAETFNHIKFRMTGPNFGHYGHTVNIKSITKDGLKVYLVNKVKLIKFEEIEQFEKAKPHSERPVREKKPVVLVEKKRKVFDKEDDEDEKETKKNKSKRGQSTEGSLYIPKSKSH